jgi:3-ketosteroid 9alpha-monooxygenase subunit A
MAHFFYIHYAFPTYFKNVFEGHIATQYMNSAAARTCPAPGTSGHLRRCGNESEASPTTARPT